MRKSVVLTFHWNLDFVFNDSCVQVVGNHNQFICSAVWSLRAKDCYFWLSISQIKDESILEVTKHLSCASTLIPRNSSCRKRVGISGENYFCLIQRRTTKSVCPPKGDVVIFCWIQWTWRSRNKGLCLLLAKKEKNHFWESLINNVVYLLSLGEKRSIAPTRLTDSPTKGTTC